MKKNIVIVGYPKSGTTWISRLVAELIECPLQGNWGFDNQKEPIKEGVERNSEFACYKSHHQLKDIFSVYNENIHTIIYVIRDPRDIVISSLYYFDNEYPKLKNLLFKIPFGNRLYIFLQRNFNFFISFTYKKKKMIDMILNGNENINKWGEISWSHHFKPYHKKKYLFISYEKMLLDPEKECNIILDRLNINKSKNHILKSITLQSFSQKKNNTNRKLLRIGKSGYWKTRLSLDDKQLFTNQLKEELLIFNYKSN